MKKWIGFLGILLSASAMAAGDSAAGQAISTTGDFVPPVLVPSTYLIRDTAVRRELGVAKEQAAALQKLCDDLDEDLFVLRDVTADPTDPDTVRHVRDAERKLGSLTKILTDSQQKRLGELSFQYEGMTTLFRPGPMARLRISPEQHEQMQFIYRQSLSNQEELARRLHEAGQDDQIAVQTQLLQFRRREQMMKVLNEHQLSQWQEMLGIPFDFSQTQTLSFRAPELRDVTEWINSRPLTMKALRGRVVVVHFWTFGCVNCAHNYPVYQQWARQYDPREVLVLGIHTPESEAEKDPAVLRNKITQEGLTFLIAVDNRKANWQAWANRVWPSVYLVDKNGRVRYWWYGELRWQGATGDQWMSAKIEELRAEPYDSK